MRALRVPYQCLEESGKFLIAARGSSIDLFSLEDLSLLSTWKCPNTQQSRAKDTNQSTAQHAPAENLESSAVQDMEASETSPPAKRRKLSDEGASQKPDDADEKAKKKSNNRSESVSSGLEAPAVVTLAVTRGSQHVIAVTGEDKSIRVFEIAVNEDGKHYLKSLSQRAMPKRPCAVAITEDDSTIIAADKFGDVYSLPLLFSQLDSPSGGTGTLRNEQTPKHFTPAANDLTVHSQRNRKALENQKKQTNKASEKIEPTFEHKLLLGHVSMLTDIAVVASHGRSYIISGDRDEHIRISRGIPQTHIIEGFCLGHTEFISRLCIPQGRQNLLISGGGDNELFVWDWLSGRLLSKVHLGSLVAGVTSEPGRDNGSPPRDEVKVAVSNISHAKLSDENGNADIILATSEGIPALFTFLLTPENALKHIQTLRVPGNALAVATCKSASESNVVVSVDCIHKPGSTTERRQGIEEAAEPLQLYKFQDHELVAASTFMLADGDDECQSVRLTNLLYNLEYLRKRDGETRELE